MHADRQADKQRGKERATEINIPSDAFGEVIVT
jgi:hypothetical protein